MNIQLICAPLSQFTDRIWQSDAETFLRSIPPGSVNCIVTSPPYFGLRDYGVSGQIGLEDTPERYVKRMVELFRLARRALRDDGVLWLNLGDSYAANRGNGASSCGPKQNSNSGSLLGSLHCPAGLKPKDLIGIPWRVALALQADGWYLRSDVIWAKPNPMPESVTDRPTKAHEYVFLLTKSEKYYCDMEAIKERATEGNDLGLLRGRQTGANDLVAWHAPSIKKRQDAGVDSHEAGNGYRNKRTVWTVATEPTPFAHFATFPQALIKPMILAGCPIGGLVCDPFMGSGTTAIVARKSGRSFTGCDLNAEYIALALSRIPPAWQPALFDVSE